MRFILAPDSFKGTASSYEICQIVKNSIQTHFKNAEIISIPIADGGEGSVDAFLHALPGNKITATATGPNGDSIKCMYGIIENGRTAVIEMAAGAGLPLAGPTSTPTCTTTYGVGQLMEDAIKKGCSKIILGLGGSATNDLGTGAAAALGVIFYNENHMPFIPTGETLAQITKIDASNCLVTKKKIDITVMCDVDNPLYGKEGAAFVFAPQKGASPEEVVMLDNGLRHAANIIQQNLGICIDTLPGAGAAGGMGGGMVAFLGGKLQMGIETVLDTVQFDSLLQSTTMVITGEGKIDTQSLRGKVVIGIAQRAKKQHVPVLALVGEIGEGADAAYDKGVTSIFSINTSPASLPLAMKNTKTNLQITADNLMRLLANTDF